MEPITAGLIATGLTIVLTTTQIGETIYNWFTDEPELCNTKVNEEPEQWALRPCIDKGEDDGRE